MEVKKAISEVPQLAILLETSYIAVAKYHKVYGHAHHNCHLDLLAFSQH